MDAAEPELDFTCPRCGTSAQSQFYGPCPDCRTQLLAAQRGTGRVVEVGRFEPSLHVVPNQVATKE